MQYSVEGQAARGFLAHVAGPSQHLGDLGAADGGHFFGADHQRDPGTTGRDRIDRGIQRRGTGSASIFDAGGGLPAQAVVGLQQQRRTKNVGHETAVQIAQPQRIDFVRHDASIGDRIARDAGDQGFQVELVEAAKRRMRPADDTSTHDISLGWFGWHLV